MLNRLKKTGIIFIAVVIFILLGVFYQKSVALDVGATAHLTANSTYATDPPGNNLASRKFKLLLYSGWTTFKS